LSDGACFPSIVASRMQGNALLTRRAVVLTSGPSGPVGGRSRAQRGPTEKKRHGKCAAHPARRRGGGSPAPPHAGQSTRPGRRPPPPPPCPPPATPIPFPSASLLFLPSYSFFPL